MILQRLFILFLIFSPNSHAHPAQIADHGAYYRDRASRGSHVDPSNEQPTPTRTAQPASVARREENLWKHVNVPLPVQTPDATTLETLPPHAIHTGRPISLSRRDKNLAAELRNYIHIPLPIQKPHETFLESSEYPKPTSTVKPIPVTRRQEDPKRRESLASELRKIFQTLAPGSAKPTGSGSLEPPKAQAHVAPKRALNTQKPAATNRPLLAAFNPDAAPVKPNTTPPPNQPSPTYALNDFLTTATGDWKKVQCTHKDLTNADVPSIIRWKAAGASELWEQLFKAYNVYLKSNKDVLDDQKYFDRLAFNALHLEDFPQCWKYGSESCNKIATCESTSAPAIWLIHNSIVRIHTTITDGFKPLLTEFFDANSKMQAFAETFGAFQKQRSLADNVFKVILDTVLAATGIGSAFSWNVFIKQRRYFRDDDYRSAWKDVFNTAVSAGINYSKDSLATIKKPSDIVAMLAASASALFKSIADSQAHFLEDLFKPNNEQSQKTLKNMVENGAMLQLAANDKTTWNQITQDMQKLYYAKMMPVAWAVSPIKQKPFILRVDRKLYKCGDPVKSNTVTKNFNLGNFMTDDTRKKAQWCDKDGNAWFLLNAEAPSDCRKHPTRFGCLEPMYYPFKTLQGGTNDVLDGKQWGISMEDIILSSYGGFVANGNKNGYKNANEKTSLVLGDDMKVKDTIFPLEAGIRTPGFFNFTICLDAMEASKRIWDGESQICPEKPKTETVSPPPNDAGYTAGWCGLHITQWPMGGTTKTKNTNPFADNYQLAITVKDATGKIIDQATKQPVNRGLIVKTKLPKELAVTVGSGKKEKPERLCFWYSDQHWCTEGADFVKDKCRVGKFEDKKREIDCGFMCSNPGDKVADTPRNDVTKDAPTAFLGNGDNPDIIGTAKNYKGGWCPIHIRQYQKTEKDNDQNPGPDFALEVTVYDADWKVIDYLDKTYAPKDKRIFAKGPLPEKLELWTGAVDSDHIHLQYGKETWDTADKKVHLCREGGYDSGIRDIDCGFRC